MADEVATPAGITLNGLTIYVGLILTSEDTFFRTCLRRLSLLVTNRQKIYFHQIAIAFNPSQINLPTITTI